MEKLIPSFKKDHNVLKPGVYGCPQKHNFLVTYDLRFVRPNSGAYMPLAAMHTIEHLMATYFKTESQYANEVVSFCPGACATMFYLELVTNHKMNLQNELVKAIEWAQEQTKVPGAKKAQCGNYKSHNLIGAQGLLAEFRNHLDNCAQAELDAGNSYYLVSNKYDLES